MRSASKGLLRRFQTKAGYDPLGRKTSETYPEGSVLTTAYCGVSMLVTDPTGRWRRSLTDALGRLVEVDEPNAVGAAVNPNGCVGTGEPIFVTSYDENGAIECGVRMAEACGSRM
jgi:hypothetical protein